MSRLCRRDCGTPRLRRRSTLTGTCGPDSDESTRTAVEAAMGNRADSLRTEGAGGWRSARSAAHRASALGVEHELGRIADVAPELRVLLGGQRSLVEPRAEVREPVLLRCPV